MDCNDVRTLVGASADGELDLVHEVELENHLKGCPACSMARERLLSLRTTMRRSELYFRAPDSLKHRVVKSATVRRISPFVLGTMAAAAALFLFAAGILAVRSRPQSESLLARQIVEDHVRSLLPGHLADVPSTDRHTVKPWFAGKIDYSPPVADFAAEGFALAGGRLDYLDGRTVAALVYRRHQHIINLFVWPSSADASLSVTTTNGYNVLSWQRGGMAYALVSDLNRAELRQFASLLSR